MLRISLVLALASMACRHEAPPPSNRAEPARALPTADALAFLPIDADVILGIDAEGLRASALWAEYQPKLAQAAGPQLANIQRTCGFDPLRAIESMTIAAYSNDSATPVVVIRGLDRDRTMACLRARILPEVTVTTDRDVVSLVNKDGDRVVFAFADRSTVVLEGFKQASPDRLRAVLHSGAPLRTSPTFVDLFGRLERGATLWMVINAKTAFDQLSALGARPRAVYGTFRARQGLSGKVHLRMSTADEAQALAGVAQGHVQQATAMFDQLAVDADGDVATITLELSLDKLRSLVSMAAMMMTSGAQSTSPTP